MTPITFASLLAALVALVLALDIPQHSARIGVAALLVFAAAYLLTRGRK